MPATKPYCGVRASLATMHDKLPLIGPAMSARLGLDVYATGTNTDAFGTFSGEIERTLPPLETAFAKARQGMIESGAIVGLASEGSIGVSGLLLVVSAVEIVAIVDDAAGFVLGESASSQAVVTHSWVIEEGHPREEDLVRAGFPEHGLIVRSVDGNGPLTKGIHDPRELKRAVEECRESGFAAVRIESDLRAHHCPSRQPVIRAAAERLAERLARLCPSCDCPGWGPVGLVRGLKCATCGVPTEGVLTHIDGCPRCSHRVTGHIREERANPSTCWNCNP
mgnify:FL=1